MDRKSRMRKYGLFLCIMLLFCAAGCGKTFDTETEDKYIPKDENLIVVGVSQIGSESVWRTANTASIQRVFTKENGYFLIFDNARQKQENQIKAIRSFISQQVDYIVFSPITEYGWETVLQEAKDAGIPVILMDRQIEKAGEKLYTAWVGSDFEKEGELAAEYLAALLEKQGKAEEETAIVMLTGTEGATSEIGRTEGFYQIAAEHANWNVVEEADGEYTTTKAKEIMKRMLKKHKKIDVVVSQNDDMTFGALEAMAEAGITPGEDGDMIVVSFDAVKSALELVEQGIISIDVECNPEQGVYIEKIIAALQEGKEVEKAYYVPEKVFTKENVGQYLENRTY